MNILRVLALLLCMLGITRLIPTSIQAVGSGRFYDDPRFDVGENSILRKILFIRKNKKTSTYFSTRIKIYNVIPYAITLVMLILAVMLCAAYGLSLLFSFPIASSLGDFLNGGIPMIISAAWYLLLGIYAVVLHCFL